MRIKKMFFIINNNVQPTITKYLHHKTYGRSFVFLFSLLLSLFLPCVSHYSQTDSLSLLNSKEENSVKEADLSFGDFTGEILPVLYVSDLKASVLFYRKLGFKFDHYFDHHTGGSVTEWTYGDSPLYAEMWAGGTRFALHKLNSPDSLIVGGSRYYFGVKDVNIHYRQLKKNGIKVSDMINRPWMNMFNVFDLDGHDIYFQTRVSD